MSMPGMSCARATVVINRAAITTTNLYATFCFIALNASTFQGRCVEHNQSLAHIGREETSALHRHAPDEISASRETRTCFASHETQVAQRSSAYARVRCNLRRGAGAEIATNIDRTNATIVIGCVE